MTIKKGYLEIVNDTAMLQTAQVTGKSDEVHENVERYQNYGFSSTPVNYDNDNGKGAACLIASSASNIPVIIATDDRRYRPKNSKSGDVVIYSTHDTPTATHDTATQRIALTDDGTSNFRLVIKIGSTKIEVKNDGTVNITATTINMNGNVNITGDIAITGNVTNGGVNISKTHKHTSAAAGSDTSTPH